MMVTGRQHDSTLLFLVRLYMKEGPEAEPQWCGKVQRVVNGEAYDFSDWPTLIDRLVTMLTDSQGVVQGGGLGPNTSGED